MALDITSYLLGKKAGGGGGSNLQSKDVTVTTNGESTITPDTGYDGMSSVGLTVNVTPNLQDKSISITQNGSTTISKDSGYDGLNEVSLSVSVPSQDRFAQIGYQTFPSNWESGLTYANTIKNNWNPTSTSTKFTSDYEVVFFPLVDTSNYTNFHDMFWYAGGLMLVPPDLNTSNVTTMRCAFGYTKLTEMPTLDFSKATTIARCFEGDEFLSKIGLLDLSSVTDLSTAFQGCKNLNTYGGFKDLGKAYLTSASANYSYYTLNVSANSWINADQSMNIINNLYDIASKGCNTQSLVLGSSNKGRLTAQQIAVATNKGWTVS